MIKRNWSELWMLPPICLDVLGNVLVSIGAALWQMKLAVFTDSRNHTLSATAWSVRDNRFFGWTHKFIDGIPFFGTGHCQAQYDREQKYGSVWVAWRVEFNPGYEPPSPTTTTTP